MKKKLLALTGMAVCCLGLTACGNGEDLGEAMAKAGLNTLIGMGTVFCVLILICLIIYCFNVIPKIQGAFAKKTEGQAAKEEVPAAQAEEPAAVDETDDLELVAVIAAAVAASEGAASTDGFVVRSIIRRL